MCRRLCPCIDVEQVKEKPWIWVRSPTSLMKKNQDCGDHNILCSSRIPFSYVYY